MVPGYDDVSPPGSRPCGEGPHLLAEHFRRIDPRYERQLDVEVVVDGKKHTSRTVNISLGGLFLDATIPLELGTTVQLRFQLPTQPEPVEVAGDVRWVVKKEGPGEEKGIGIRFQGLRAPDGWALNPYFQTA